MPSNTRSVVDVLKIAWQCTNALCFYISPYRSSDQYGDGFFCLSLRKLGCAWGLGIRIRRSTLNLMLLHHH